MGAAITAAVITAVAVSSSGIYAANKQSGTAKDAADTQSDAAKASAKLQTDSANYAADIQAKSAREALDYTRGQSQLSLDQYNQQQTRLQPYRNLGNFALGQPMESALAPLQLPGMTGQSGQPPQSSVGASPTVSAANGDIASQVAAYFKTRGVTPNPTSVDYWAQKWTEFGANDPAYFNQRLAIADEFSGAGVAAARRAPVQLPFAPVNALKPTTPLTPALQAPRLRYRPLGSIGDY